MNGALYDGREQGCDVHLPWQDQKWSAIEDEIIESDRIQSHEHGFAHPFPESLMLIKSKKCISHHKEPTCKELFQQTIAQILTMNVLRFSDTVDLF